MYIAPWPCPTSAQLAFRSRRVLPYPLSSDNRKFFYVARNGIYHLFRALHLEPAENVLVPDYHSGNETSAIRATGATMRFYPIRRDLQPDREAIARLCTPQTRALYLIHFIGWPQPIDWALDFCRQRKLVLIEDCALSFLSEYRGRALGSFGDYAVHCLYKTLPVPNGAVLTENRDPLAELLQVKTTEPKSIAALGRSAELLVESLRSRFPGIGGKLAEVKAATGRALTAASVERERVGTIGFDIDKVDIGMSPACRWLLARFNYEWIRERRRANYLQLEARLQGRISMLPIELSEGVCPLFLPILVDDKHAVAEELRGRGIGVVEFWNEGDPAARTAASEDATYLRDHVLELPIHQNVTDAQLDYIAGEVLARVRPVRTALSLEKPKQEAACSAR